MTETKPPPLSRYWREWSERASSRASRGWLEMVDELRLLQDAVAAAAPPADVVTQVHDLLTTARRLLEPHAVDDERQIYGKLLQTPGRGQTLSPPLRILRWSATELEATTTFGRFHTGSNDAVHGGAIALMFDEALGHLTSVDERPPSRTASLEVRFRHVTPIGRPLSVRVELLEQVGRKHRLRGELRDGGRLCAEAEALFIALRDDQR